MPPNHRHLILLGPQPNYESLREVLHGYQVNFPVAIVTAGWQTLESLDDRLLGNLPTQGINLNLFARSEKMFADDPDLIKGLQARQDELRHLRQAYNDRLHHQLKAARQILRRKEDLINLDAERESAIEMVRQLDRQHFLRASQIIHRFENELQINQRPHVIQHRQEIASVMNNVGALLISGGHVAIILNRLKIFGILDMRQDIPIIAWSGGAMALSDQVVFFHDSPPQGQGDAEVLRAGMGLFSDILPLPDARTRLKLNDHARVELFSRRFQQFKCVIFDEHTVLERKPNSNWVSQTSQPSTRLGESGTVVEFQV